MNFKNIKEYITVKTFTNPETVELYEKSNYTDERHFALSLLVEAAEGIKYENQEDLKKSIFRNVFNDCIYALRNEDFFECDNEKVICIIDETLWEGYRSLVYYLLKRLRESGKALNDDILDVVYSTMHTESYIMKLVDEYVDCI